MNYLNSHLHDIDKFIDKSNEIVKKNKSINEVTELLKVMECLK